MKEEQLTGSSLLITFGCMDHNELWKVLRDITVI